MLLGPGGAELWRDAGPLRAERLLEVLKRQDLKGAKHPRQLPVRLELEAGLIAPDFIFQCTPPIATADFTLSTTKMRGTELESNELQDLANVARGW